MASDQASAPLFLLGCPTRLLWNAEFSSKVRRDPSSAAVACFAAAKTSSPPGSH